MVLVAIPLGLAVGLAVGALGGGGSVLAVPVLVYVLGQSVHQATTASLVVVTAGALAGSIGHAREGHVCWRHAAVFAGAALPGVIVGTALGDAVSGRTLVGAFSIVMLGAAVVTWRKADGKGIKERSPRASCPPLRLAQGLAAGLLVGAMTGFFGVGGGFLIVPTLAILLTFSMRLAIGTSVAIISLTSVMGLATHLLAGRGLDVPLTAAMTAGCMAGALAGSRLAGRLPQRQLGRTFAGLVLLVAAYLFVSAAFLGGPPGS